MNQAEIAEKLKEKLGEKGILTVPSGRPYFRIAVKGEARLHSNFQLETGPAQLDGKTVGAVVLVARFFQLGGEKDTFAPPLKVRASGPDAFRLSKHHFPICTLCPPFKARQSWDAQDGTSKALAWLDGISEYAGAQLLTEETIRMVIEYGLPEAVNTEKEPTALLSMHTKADITALVDQMFESDPEATPDEAPQGDDAGEEENGDTEDEEYGVDSADLEDQEDEDSEEDK